MTLFESWLKSISPKTRETYEKVWGEFWEWARPRYFADMKALGEITTESAMLVHSQEDLLITHRFEELKRDPPERFHCEDLVTGWYNHLKDTADLSDLSLRAYVSIVKSFFKFGTRGAGKLGLQIKFGKRRVRFKYTPTQLDLVKLRRYCSPRTWALVAAMKDSGFGPDQLAHIKWEQTAKMEGNSDYWFIFGQREKTDEVFATFFGPDATKAITAVYGNWDVADVPQLFTNELRKPYTSEAIRMAVWRAMRDADMPKGMSPYSLRAFFNTQLEIAKVPDNWRKRMMGHSLGDVQGAYSKPQVEALFAVYKPAYHHLSIESNGGAETINANDALEFVMAFMRGDKVRMDELLAKYPQLSKYTLPKATLVESDKT